LSSLQRLLVAQITKEARSLREMQLALLGSSSRRKARQTKEDLTAHFTLFSSTKAE